MRRNQNNAIAFSNQQLEEIHQKLAGLQLKSMAMLVIFNDGTHHEFSTTSFSYEDNMNLCASELQEDYYIFEKKTQIFNKFQPIFNIIRRHAEGVFIFTALGEYPKESASIFHNRIIAQFETLCMHLLDKFLEQIPMSNLACRYSFVLNNKLLRDAAIRQGFETEIQMSARERECLWYIGLGKTIKEVARQLGISPYTVEWHLARIRRTFNGRRIPEIMLECMQRGIFGKMSLLQKRIF